MLEDIKEKYHDGEFMVADGFDKAVIGIEEESMRLIYSTKKCIQILMKDIPEYEALEYFTFNVSGAYMGENTPIWCNDYL